MDKSKAIRTLGFHYHIPIENINGELRTPAYFGFFIDSLAPHFDKIVCFMHSKGSMAIEMDYAIQSSNVELIDLGPYDRIFVRKFKFWREKSELKISLKGIDRLLVRASTPLLKNFYGLVGDGIVLMLVSNAVDGLDQLNQPKWRLRLIKYWARKYQDFEDLLSKRLLTLVNSQRLLEDHQTISSRLHRIKTTTLSSKDFVERKPDFSPSGIQLLYTGRVAPNKGIQDVIEALIDLRNRGVQLSLKVVGPFNTEDEFYQGLVKSVQKAGIEDKVEFVGYVTAGDKLLSHYRASDLFVMASKSSAEGFPRVLWEAMASSLPIIASRVSGIDKVLEGKAKFFAPGNVTELIKAIEETIEDKEGRNQRIVDARELARDNTLERSGEHIAHLIKTEG